MPRLVRCAAAASPTGPAPMTTTGSCSALMTIPALQVGIGDARSALDGLGGISGGEVGDAAAGVDGDRAAFAGGLRKVFARSLHTALGRCEADAELVGDRLHRAPFHVDPAQELGNIVGQ